MSIGRSIENHRDAQHPSIAKINRILKLTGLRQLGSIRCKHIARWQDLSQIKARLLWLAENVLSQIKTQQPTSRTSAAAYELMERHCKENKRKCMEGLFVRFAGKPKKISVGHFYNWLV